MSCMGLNSLQYRKFGLIQQIKKDPGSKLGSEDKEDKELMLNS